MTDEKLRPAFTKATTGIEKSFKLIVLAVTMNDGEERRR